MENNSKVQLTNRDSEAIFPQITRTGGLLNLAAGKVDPEGFYLAVAPAGTEGLLLVKFKGDTTVCTMPVYKNWNPMLVTEVTVSGSNTASTVYWGK